MSTDKLKKLQSIQKELLYLLELSSKANKAKVKPKGQTVAYKDGLNVLLNKHSFNELVSSKNKITTAAITSSFKSMIPLLQEEVNLICRQESNKFLEAFNKLNTYDSILPNQDRIAKIINDYISNVEKKIIGLISTESLAIFNQGKQHQGIITGKKDISKFLYSTEEDKLYFENHLKNITRYIKSNTNKNIILEQLNDLYTKNLSKNNLINFIKKNSKLLSNRIDFLIDIISWWTYTQGNLYQLSKDGVQFVRWNTSHCLHDCIECRDIQNGKSKLYADGIELNSFMTENGAIYNFNDIKSYIGNYGMEMLSHKDCRCQFIKAL